MQAHYFDTATGRFVSEDPKHEGNNWLIYCTNDAVTGCDPTGCEPIGWDDIGLMLLGAVVGGLVACALQCHFSWATFARHTAMSIRARTERRLAPHRRTWAAEETV